MSSGILTGPIAGSGRRPAARDMKSVSCEPGAGGLARGLDRAAPWFVFGLAAALRLGQLDLAAFTFDDADAILRARALAAGQPALIGGMTSWGIPDPPLVVYVLASVAGLPSPALASLGLMALLNALAVLATYAFAARFFGRRYALLAGLLYAVNPWAIYFGRRAWVQLQPAITILALWASFEVVVERRPRFALPFFLALAGCVQARLLALAYAPAALAGLALGGRRWLSGWSLLGLLGGAVLSLPYLTHLLANRDSILAALGDGNRGVAAGPRGGVVEFAWWVTAGYNLLPTPAGLAGWLDGLGGVLTVEAWLAGGLLLSGLLLGLVRCVRRCPGWERYALLVAWATLPLGLLAFQRSTVYLHYLVLLFPLPFLLLALPLDGLLRRRQAPLRALALALVLAVALPQVATWLALQRALTVYSADETVEAPLAERRLLAELARESGQRLGTGESYGVEVPLRFWLAVADRTRTELADRPRPLLVATDGTNPAAEQRPALLAAVLGPDPAPRYQGPGALVLPLDRAALLLVTSDVEPALAPDRIGAQQALIPLPTLARNTRDGVRLFDLPPRSAEAWAEAVGATRRARGAGADPRVAARAMRTARPGEMLEMLTLWSRPGAALRPVVGLVDTGGQHLAEKESDRRPVDLPPGHLLASRHQLQVPNRATPGEYRLVIEARSGAARDERFDLGSLAVISQR